MKATRIKFRRARPYFQYPSPYRCGLCNNLERVDTYSSSGSWDPFRLRNPSPTAADLVMGYDEQCPFCGIALEGFWLIAEKLGYKRDYLHDDFNWIAVGYDIPVDPSKGKALVAYHPDYRCEKERKHVWDDWHGKRWNFELREKGDCDFSDSNITNAWSSSYLTLVCFECG